MLGQAIGELIQEFNAVSSYKEAIEGRWRHGETLYRDDLALLVVDVPDTAKNRKWMKAYKARWKNRLRDGWPLRNMRYTLRSKNGEKCHISSGSGARSRTGSYDSLS